MKQMLDRCMRFVLEEERRVGLAILATAKKNPIRVHLFFVFACMILISSIVPYFNIVFDTATSVFAVGLMGILLFYPSSNMVMFMVMLMLGVSTIGGLTHQEGLRERIGNLMYLTLWIYVYRCIVEIWQTKEK